MKKLSIVFLSMMFTVVMFGQGQKEPEKAIENKNAPVMTFEKGTHDYGTIEYNGNGVCFFVFTNTGKEPLILSNARSTCGCTVPSWPREPILPGQTDSIQVRYVTTRVGQINKSVTVTSNASNSPVVLRVVGKVLPNPNATPPAVQQQAPKPAAQQAQRQAAPERKTESPLRTKEKE